MKRRTHACHDMENIPYMKTLYIFLTRSGTLLSNLVYHLTGAQYTHVSLAFDEDLSTLYSSTRKNGYTMFPAGPSREYLNRGVFLQRENIPCPGWSACIPARCGGCPSASRWSWARRRAWWACTSGWPSAWQKARCAGCGAGSETGFFWCFWPLLRGKQVRPKTILKNLKFLVDKVGLLC